MKDYRINILIVIASINIYLLIKSFVSHSEIKAVKSQIENNFITAERAYFEGQKDAMNGDLRIGRAVLNGHTCYFWTKNCWDNSSRVVQFIPTCQ